ncbi:MAG: Crp/Fnr family transcriptional regulator [Microcystaceae cyanobacterium]
MEINEVSDLFPLFTTTNTKVIQWLLSVVETENYTPDSVIVREEDWGKSVYFVASGWVKLVFYGGEQEVTLDIRSEGDYFGEVAVLDQPLKLTKAIALSEVSLLRISAQRFLQMLFKDPQLQHKILQLTIQRVRHGYRLFQVSHQPPKLKLVKVLVNLAEKYGKPTERGVEIFQLSSPDLANLAHINPQDGQEILLKLQRKGWIEMDSNQQILAIPNLKNLHHLVKQI